MRPKPKQRESTSGSSAANGRRARARPAPARRIFDPRLEAYLDALGAPGEPLLVEMTAEGRRRGFPIVGPQVGRLLEALARSLRARRVFELGSGFGYSTVWFARGMQSGGVVHHTDGDPANSELARRLLARANVAPEVVFHVGDAVRILRELRDPEPFDIVFCDIDKHQYPAALDAMRPRVRVGGFIVIDNLLWEGKVADPRVRDRDTRGIRTYTKRMWTDPDFLSALLPIRDGVGLHLRLR
jgi:predicted O-methyltransferase YrrM